MNTASSGNIIGLLVGALIATLGTMVAVRGIALIYSNGQPIFDFIPSLNTIGGSLGPITIYAIMIFITWGLLDNTRFGTNAFSIGGTSQYGGVGTVWGSVVGTLTMTVMWNGMTLWGVSAYWQKVV